jgi:hypothetical protein
MLMEKHILHWSYWLGMASLVIAVVWKGLNAFGLGLPMLFTREQSVFYLTFYKASLLLFVAAIASANYARFKSQKP